MQTLMDVEQKRLLKKFHTLLANAGIDTDGKLSLLAQYNVQSSKDLTAYELLEVCNKLSLQSDKKLGDLDRCRKRLIASIFALRYEMNCHPSMAEVIGIAEQAAGGISFNKIQISKLRSLYNAFLQEKKDILLVRKMNKEFVIEIRQQN